jgi:hypothetical protein
VPRVKANASDNRGAFLGSVYLLKLRLDRHRTLPTNDKRTFERTKVSKAEAIRRRGNLLGIRAGPLGGRVSVVHADRT